MDKIGRAFGQNRTLGNLQVTWWIRIRRTESDTVFPPSFGTGVSALGSVGFDLEFSDLSDGKANESCET